MDSTSKPVVELEFELARESVFCIVSVIAFKINASRMRKCVNDLASRANYVSPSRDDRAEGRQRDMSTSCASSSTVSHVSAKPWFLTFNEESRDVFVWDATTAEGRRIGGRSPQCQRSKCSGEDDHCEHTSCIYFTTTSKLSR